MTTEYIEKQAAIKALGEEPDYYSGSMFNSGKVVQWRSDSESIKAIPPADVRPIRRGQWIFTPTRGYVCSVCNGSVGYDRRSNFCPHCGADILGTASI